MTQKWALFNLTANEQTKGVYTTHKQPKWRYPLSVNRQRNGQATETKNAINLTRRGHQVRSITKEK